MMWERLPQKMIVTQSLGLYCATNYSGYCTLAGAANLSIIEMVYGAYIQSMG